jgi:hypothetical protein
VKTIFPKLIFLSSFFQKKNESLLFQLDLTEFFLIWLEFCRKPKKRSAIGVAVSSIWRLVGAAALNA